MSQEAAVAKAKLIKRIKRWMALDAALYLGEVRLATVAKSLGVTERTIRRDLEGLAMLGYKAHKREDDKGRISYRYHHNKRPLFVHGYVIGHDDEKPRWGPRKIPHQSS